MRPTEDTANRLESLARLAIALLVGVILWSLLRRRS